MNCHRRIAADGPADGRRRGFDRALKGFAAILLLLLLAGCGSAPSTDTAEGVESPEESAAVRVAILDSGLSWEEDSLTDIGWNYLEENQSTQDDKGHGTQVAKLIRLYAPDAVLVPLKITDSMSDATGQIVVRAIYDAVDRFECDVLCLAFSIPPSEELSDAVAYAEEQQAVLVSAAGNLGQTYKKDKLLYPAAYETVIGVGAIGQDGAVADYSQRNRSVFVTALGESIDGTQQGTSFAAARIAGICADLRWTTPEMCRSSLRSQALDCGSAGYDTEYGWGVLAAPSAAKAVAAPTVTEGPPTENTTQDILYETDRQAATEPPEDIQMSEAIETAPPEAIPEPGEAGKFPQYFQNDYPDVRYGTGTIATSGCSVTALAMVATYLTGHTYLPDELAEAFSTYNCINNIEKLEYMAQMLQLPWRRAENFHIALDALKDGKIVIALMNETSIFTTGQHFIVWTGIKEDGKIMVNDPNKNNYSLWNLENAFRNGFDEGDICCGYDGAWIFDSAEMPEEPFIYVEDKVAVECRYPGVELTLEEEDLLARMVWVEAQGEPFEGQQAIAEIVLNRLVSDAYPNSIHSVIYAENQFRSTPFLEDAKPSSVQYKAIECALEGPYVLPMDVVFFATYPVNENVWGEIGGHVFCYQNS